MNAVIKYFSGQIDCIIINYLPAKAPHFPFWCGSVFPKYKGRFYYGWLATRGKKIEYVSGMLLSVNTAGAVALMAFAITS